MRNILNTSDTNFALMLYVTGGLSAKSSILESNCHNETMLKELLEKVKIKYNKKVTSETIVIADDEAYHRLKKLLSTRDHKVLPESSFKDIQSLSGKFADDANVIFNLTENDIEFRTGGLSKLFKGIGNDAEALNIIINHVDKMYWGIVSDNDYDRMPINRKKYFIPVSVFSNIITLSPTL